MSELILSRVEQTLEALRLHAARAALGDHLRAVTERELSPLQLLDTRDNESIW